MKNKNEEVAGKAQQLSRVNANTRARVEIPNDVINTIKMQYHHYLVFWHHTPKYQNVVSLKPPNFTKS
jgi:hypothetical protein